MSYLSSQIVFCQIVLFHQVILPEKIAQKIWMIFRLRSDSQKSRQCEVSTMYTGIRHT